jgi:hypothetical protein
MERNVVKNSNRAIHFPFSSFYTSLESCVKSMLLQEQAMNATAEMGSTIEAHGRFLWILPAALLCTTFLAQTFEGRQGCDPSGIREVVSPPTLIPPAMQDRKRTLRAHWRFRRGRSCPCG